MRVTPDAERRCHDEFDPPMIICPAPPRRTGVSGLPERVMDSIPTRGALTMRNLAAPAARRGEERGGGIDEIRPRPDHRKGAEPNARDREHHG